MNESEGGQTEVIKDRYKWIFFKWPRAPVEMVIEGSRVERVGNPIRIIAALGYEAIVFVVVREGFVVLDTVETGCWGSFVGL